MREEEHSDGIIWESHALVHTIVVVYSPGLEWHSHIWLSGGFVHVRSENIWPRPGTALWGGTPLLESNHQQGVRKKGLGSALIWCHAVFVEKSASHASCCEWFWAAGVQNVRFWTWGVDCLASDSVRLGQGWAGSHSICLPATKGCILLSKSVLWCRLDTIRFEHDKDKLLGSFLLPLRWKLLSSTHVWCQTLLASTLWMYKKYWPRHWERRNSIIPPGSVLIDHGYSKHAGVEWQWRTLPTVIYLFDSWISGAGNANAFAYGSALRLAAMVERR